MIKPEEFRIGSTVWLKSKDKPYTIASGHDIDEGIDSDDFEPVPLTEEWLLKFGFEKGSNETNKKCFYKRDFVFIFYSDGIGGRFSKCFFQSACTHTLSEIKYVHQLQNLFYALTGEELQIKN